jgi:hypothetical protein
MQPGLSKGCHIQDGIGNPLEFAGTGRAGQQTRPFPRPQGRRRRRKGLRQRGKNQDVRQVKKWEGLYEVRGEMEKVLEGRKPEIELGAEPGECAQRGGDGKQEVRTLTTLRSKMA